MTIKTTLRVRAVDGKLCPVEGGKPAQFVARDRKHPFAPTEAEDVPNTPYYRKMIAQGSLVEVPASEDVLTQILNSQQAGK